MLELRIYKGKNVIWVRYRGINYNSLYLQTNDWQSTVLQMTHQHVLTHFSEYLSGFWDMKLILERVWLNYWASTYRSQLLSIIFNKECLSLSLFWTWTYRGYILLQDYFKISTVLVRYIIITNLLVSLIIHFVY